MLTLAVLFVAIACGLNAPPGTKITSLPNFPANTPLPSMYSGYVNGELHTIAGDRTRDLFFFCVPKRSRSNTMLAVDAVNGRALFYVLVEATGVDPKTAPLVFWYQGGPGCSGLGGFLTENGPITIDTKTGAPKLTSISWTSIANIVYLEQPAFVGWSYSNTSSDRNTGDHRATVDNVAFVKGFLSLYPDYQGRTTWFTGESTTVLIHCCCWCA